MTEVSVVARIVCITQTMVPIPEARVLADENLFFTRKTIFRVTKKTGGARHTDQMFIFDRCLSVKIRVPTKS